MRFFATPPVHGSLAQHVVHPADLAFKIPDNVSLEEVRPLRWTGMAWASCGIVCHHG
jgi:NADPH:quinone reductase-like Zn-dependent oxidoreductase